MTITTAFVMGFESSIPDTISRASVQELVRVPPELSLLGSWAVGLGALLTEQDLLTLSQVFADDGLHPTALDVVTAAIEHFGHLRQLVEVTGHAVSVRGPAQLCQTTEAGGTYI
jgi:hypothetical protein